MTDIADFPPPPHHHKTRNFPHAGTATMRMITRACVQGDCACKVAAQPDLAAGSRLAGKAVVSAANDIQ